MFSVRTLEIRGYEGGSLRNTYWKQDSGASHLAILLPGWSYSCWGSLLYYPTKLLLSHGADVFWIEYQYDQRADFKMLSDEKGEAWLFSDVTAAAHAILKERPYRKTTLIGKSLGTLAAGHLASTIPALKSSSIIWLTPLIKHQKLRTEIIRLENPSLFVIGTRDSHYDSKYLAELDRKPQNQILTIAGADHSLEIKRSLFKSLDILTRVLEAIAGFVSQV